MRKLFSIGVLMIMSLLACQQEPDTLKLLDELVVSTSYDTTIDFSSYFTYSLATDTIGFVSNKNPNDTIIVHQESDFPRPVLQQVELEPE